MSGVRVVFLGTGGALNVERYQASMVVEAPGVRILLDTGGGLEPLLISIAIPIVRAGGTPPPMRLYASADTAAAVRASLAAAAASGERYFGARLAWVTPFFGARIPIADGVILITVAVDTMHAAAPPPGRGHAPLPRPDEAARGGDLLIHEVGRDLAVLHHEDFCAAGEAPRLGHEIRGLP